MSIEDEIRAVAAMDQSEAAMKSMADVIAGFWTRLVSSGVSMEAATELTRPLVIKILGGTPE